MRADQLLLKARKHYRVNSPIIAREFFKIYMDCGFGGRGLKIRFVEIPEKCAIELQARHMGPLLQMERAFKDAGIIKHEIPFEINKVVKLTFGRRDGLDFE